MNQPLPADILSHGGAYASLDRRVDIFDAPRFSLCTEGSARRLAVERFIEHQFFRSYGAILREYLPYLIFMETQTGMAAASGFALAVEKNPLFLERYLGASVEDVLSERVGSVVRRNQIAEVGNLAGSTFGAQHIGSSRLLYIILASTLASAGLEWMVFTATTPLLNSLKRLGLSPVDLGAASELSLAPSERQRWGSYYDHGPRVAAAPLSNASESIRSRAQFAAIQEHYGEVILAMARQVSDLSGAKSDD